MIRRRAALAALVAQSCLLVWLFLSLWLLPGDDALHDRAVVGLYAVALGLLGGTGSHSPVGGTIHSPRC